MNQDTIYTSGCQLYEVMFRHIDTETLETTLKVLSIEKLTMILDTCNKVLDSAMSSVEVSNVD